MPVEGVLNQGYHERKRGLSGEAPQAMPVEGVLNPNDSVLNPNNRRGPYFLYTPYSLAASIMARRFSGLASVRSAVPEVSI